MARRVPRRPPEVAAAEHQRESFGGAERGRSSVPLPVSRDSKTLARLRSGAANRLETVRAYQDTFTLAGGAETVELTYLPLTFSEHVYMNGVYQREGESYDWTRDSGTRNVNVLTPMDARAGDILIVEYLYYAGVTAPPSDSTPVNAEYVAVATPVFDMTSISPSLPAGVSDGDLLILHLAAAARSGGASFSGLSGWTLEGTVTSTNNDQNNYATCAVYTRTYNSGSYSGPTITASNLQSGFAGTISAWSGTIEGVGVVGTWGSSSSGPTFNTPGITTTVDGMLVYQCIAGADDLEVGSFTAAGISGYPSGDFSADVGITNTVIAAAWGTDATAGATGTISYQTLAEATAAVTLGIR